MRLKLRNTKERLRREAADWFTRLQSGRDPDCETKFRQWYSADPAHAAAFERIRESHQKSGLYRWSQVYSVERLEPASRTRPTFPSHAFAAAAALALAVLGILLLRVNPFAPPETDAVMLKTNVGEIRQVRLSDGSSVTLDTSTSVEVDVSSSHRKARLNYGRARFEVAAGEPFTVEAGRETVTANHGTLDIEHQAEQSRVDVLAGRSQLQVAGGNGVRTLTLTAKEGALSNDGTPIQTYKLTSTDDWTRGMLQFDATPLSEAVTMANRYSDQRLILDGDLGELKVTGAFRAGDNQGLARALAGAFNLSVHQSADANWHLSKAGVAALPH